MENAAEYNEFYDESIPETVFVHGPTGNRAIRKGFGFLLEKGSVVAESCENGSLYTGTHEAVVECQCRDGRTTERINLFNLENIDFVTTGRTPTDESLALWTEVRRS